LTAASDSVSAATALDDDGKSIAQKNIEATSRDWIRGLLIELMAALGLRAVRMMLEPGLKNIIVRPGRLMITVRPRLTPLFCASATRLHPLPIFGIGVIASVFVGASEGPRSLRVNGPWRTTRTYSTRQPTVTAISLGFFPDF
jgi:hypothetical protein